MCGITGFNWNDETLIKEMTTIISHRGPDAKGYFSDEKMSLGHRRLSIIDLSDAGSQPMTNQKENIWITYNGEIYNFKEIRNHLKNKGYKFHSNTDTEVIIHGYKEWGEKIVEKLNGMFAFAIWNTEKQELFLARDRLGIKPLYYYWDGKKLIFGSEIKSILVHDIKREVNKKAARDYLNLRYIPGEYTLFQNIKKLLPGHTLTLKKKNIHINQFWNVPLPLPEKCNEKELRIRFADSVKKRLMADVPVGVYLSGGIDSASIVAAASKFKSEPIKTFTVGFNHNNDVDELQKAKFISDHFNTDHHEIVIDHPISDLMTKILWHLDMPHGDPVVIPQFKLSELASKKVKVVLSGEGADETFGGYVQYQKILQTQKLRNLPQNMMTNIAQKVPVNVFDKMFDYPSSIGEKGKEKALDLIKDIKNPEKAYFDMVSITSKKDRELLLTKFGSIEQDKATFQKGRKPLLNQMLYYDMKTWMPNYVLHINDRMTMANSIEGRVPFLDHTLVEFANRIDPSLKIKKGIRKAILRKAMAPALPKQVVKTKKHPFLTPLDTWYKNELRDLSEKLFSKNNVQKRGYFQHEHLKKIWENYNKSKLLYGKQLFTMINFELWHRMFIDAESIPKNNNMRMSDLT